MKISIHLLKSISIVLVAMCTSCTQFEEVSEFRKSNQSVEAALEVISDGELEVVTDEDLDVFTEGEMGQGFKPKQELVTRD